MSQVFGVSWYRFCRTLRRRWPGYLSVVLLVGLLGGVAMASISAARRTQSSYPIFLASTNPSDLSVAVYSPGTGAPGANLLTTLVRLSGVKRVAPVYSPSVAPLAPNGTPLLADLAQVTIAGGLDSCSLGGIGSR